MKVARAIARALAALAGPGIATSSLLAACEPQDIFLFDAAPSQTRIDVDAGVTQVPSRPSPNGVETTPPASPPLSTADDAGPPSVQPACESAACDACVAREDCSAARGQVFCHPVTGDCLLACDPGAPPAEIGNCPTTELCDPRLGLCVGCLINANCGGQLGVCDRSRGSCVECVASQDCPLGRPVCDTQASRCVECISNRDCGGATPVCLPGLQRCAQCANDADCRGLEDDIHCLPGEQRCVECVSNADCTRDPQKPICSSERECDDADDSGKDDD